MTDYKGFRIKELWAYTSIDEKDDQEGIISELINGAWMPFIASDKSRSDSIRERALSIAKATNKTVLLKKFNQMECIEVIHKAMEKK